MARAIVIGAGVSGIAAALELEKAGLDVTVLEEGDRAGGALRSTRAEGFTFEDGPTSVFDSDGGFRDLCRELGIDGDVIEAGREARTRYVFHDGALRVVPDGPAEILKSPLVSFREGLRLAKEAFVAPRTDGVEETVSQFLARRFGESLADKFASALVSGIFAGDPGRLSVDAAFPEVRAMEREHGSILKAGAAKAREKGSGPRRSLLSLRPGLGAVGDAFARRLGPRLRTRARVSAIARGGSGVAVTAGKDGASERVDADAVVVATPAAGAAKLVQPLAREAAEALAGIEHASVAIVQAGFRKEDLPGLPPGFGFLVSRSAGLESLGWIFLSQVFESRAPGDAVALSGFFGGVLAPRPLSLADPELLELALGELGRAVGVARPARPVFARVVRWPAALPQYVLGHRERVERITSALRRDAPEVFLAGSYLTGISIARSLASGREAAALAIRKVGAA